MIKNLFYKQNAEVFFVISRHSSVDANSGTSKSVKRDLKPSIEIMKNRRTATHFIPLQGFEEAITYII